uniref:GPI transamidase component PIG-T n=1 Tax=Ciona intestinalis TaxID=7719 RepID=UPI000180B803|nr:GPI transamidase component PIG-T [Ciona intestinalis]|eukprot:XP_002126904.1 GPI transamidase component PIG-T [Ciona intestinalis]
MHFNVLLFVVVSTVSASTSNNDSFHESLNIRVLGNEQVYSFFNFTTNWDFENEFNKTHYNLFPRSIGQIVQKYEIAELHFTMTQGLWRYQLWGFPDASAPTGAQVWVWFKKGTRNIDDKWKGFTNALSGTFCASLNLINHEVTVSPKVSFRPTGVVESADNSLLRHGGLSRENLCTENLTPWMKLLPCGSKHGPSSLLNPSSLQHSRYLSIGLHYNSLCHDVACSSTYVQLQQHVSVVHDIRTTLDQYPNFSLASIFDRPLHPSCPLATTSHTHIAPPLDVDITPTMETRGQLKYLDLRNLNSPTNIKFTWRRLPRSPTPETMGIGSHCYITGLGQDGGITCLLTNNEHYNVSIIFLQVIPWYLRAQIHTLTVKTNTGSDIEPTWLSFTPAHIRGSPHNLEMVLSLPRESRVTLSLGFDRGFMTWVTHPPDANHGFYIQPSMITIPAPHGVVRVYGEALLVNIPVPDFSMPYNVICLVCTVLAIAFGSLHNLSTRKFEVVPKSSPNNLFGKFVSVFKKSSR